MDDELPNEPVRLAERDRRFLAARQRADEIIRQMARDARQLAAEMAVEPIEGEKRDG